MTYCVGMRLDAGLVMLADSRTNAGVDHVGTFRKMSVFENPGDRVMVIMTVGNLSISQAVRQVVIDSVGEDGMTIWNVPNMFEAARILGDAVRTGNKRDAEDLAGFGVDFNISIILGGQIKGERCRLFHIYSAGNFIESYNENTYFQVGEAKYGKPIIDRVITPLTSLDDAAKCALISIDSTLRSNISVGFPLDLLVYENDSLAIRRFATIDENNQYFQTLRSSWGQQLKSVFEGMDAPLWDDGPGHAAKVQSTSNMHSKPVLIDAPAELAPAVPAAPVQSLADQAMPKSQP